MSHGDREYGELLTWDLVSGYSDRWDLYKRLIGAIPEDIVVERACMGRHWCYVEAGGAMGMSMVVGGGASGFGLTQRIDGMRLRDLACQAVSWNFLEATMGGAALNTWYSSESVARSNGMIIEDGENDGFRLYADRIKGKKVTVVGHFPLIERLADTCDLTILERVPQDGDLPDSACEYILDEQDFLFMTGITLTNKTMPRLLQLGSSCQIILVGPSVVPSPIFFDYGVVSMAGSICLPNRMDLVRLGIEQGGTSGIFKQGVQKMRVERPDWNN